MAAQLLDLQLLGAPLIGSAVNVVVHVLLCRLRWGGAHLGPVMIAFAAGFVVQAVVTYCVLNAPAINLATLMAYGLLNSVCFGALGYCYFTFVNLSATSLRIRILRQLRHAPGHMLSTAKILSSYNSTGITHDRIFRLKSWGQLLERDGRIVISGKPAFLRLAGLVDMLRAMVFGSSTRTVSGLIDSASSLGMQSISPEIRPCQLLFRGGLWERTDLWVGLGIFVVLFLAYSSPVFLPYLLLDDNWIMRGHDERGSYPSLEFIAGLQGRPLFAVLIFLSRQLASTLTPLDAMIIIRFACIALLAVCGLIVYKFSRALGLALSDSVCVGIVAMTLPTFQVFVGNGPWLAVPLLLVLAAVYVTMVGLRERHASILRLFVLQQLLFLCALGTYQSIVLVAVPFVLLAVLFGTPIRDRFVLYTLGGLITSVALYYLAWRLVWFVFADGRVEYRYSPRNISLDIATPLSRLIDFRLPQALNLWRISSDSLGYAVLIFVLGGGVAAFAGSRRGDMRAATGFAKSLVILGVAIAMSDAIAIASRQPVISYTALSGLSLVVCFSLIWALQGYASLNAEKGKKIFQALMIALTVTAVLSCQYTVTRTFAIPVWAESQLIRERLEYSLRNRGGIDEIVVYINKKLFVKGGVYEYTFSNLENAFYVRWSIRNILRDLGASEEVEIKTVTEGQKLGLSALLDKSGKIRRLVVIDLGGSSGSLWKLGFIDQQTLKAVSYLGKLLDQEDEEVFRKELADALKKYGRVVFDVDLISGRSLLSTALCKNRNLAVASLLESGADPNSIDANGGLPVACTAEISQLKLLIAHGLKELAKDSAGMPTLHALVELNRVEAARFLLDQGYAVDPTGGDGRIPLHTAAHYGYLDMVRLLLSRGSKINVRTIYGVTPLDWAIANNHTETVKVLRRHGALSAREIKGG